MSLVHMKVNSVNNNLRSKEYAERENLKNLYSRNIAPSIAYDTEKFLKAKNLLSPIFNHNEAITKYDMISRLENKNKDLENYYQLYVAGAPAYIFSYFLQKNMFDKNKT